MSSPSDYYYRYSKNGRRIFYRTRDNTIVAKKDIPASFIDRITVDRSSTKEELIKEREALQKDIRKLQEKLVALNIRIDNYEEDKDAQKERVERQRKKEEEAKIRQKKREEERKKENKKWEDLFRQAQENLRREEERAKESARQRAREYQEDILKSNCIDSKRTWLKWLKKNHPDKGGSDALCQEVIAAGRKQGW